MNHDLTHTIASYSLKAILLGALLLSLLTVLSVLIQHRKEKVKLVLFIGFVLTTVTITLFLVASTIYLNYISISSGPVHWHADIEIWACGEELNLKDPEGLSNKVGTPIFHEHNDKRIHFEGVLVTPLEASLGKFFQVIGGEITNQTLVVPTNEGKKAFVSGQPCPYAPSAQVQVFVYKVEGRKVTQHKLTNPGNYIISPHTQVPPGDCIIVEFDAPKMQTDKLCQSFKTARILNKIE